MLASNEVEKSTAFNPAFSSKISVAASAVTYIEAHAITPMTT